jgi:hypothetical protein
MDTNTVLKRVRETRLGDGTSAPTGLARLIGLPVEVMLDEKDPPRRSVIESTDSRIEANQAGALRCRAAIPNTDGLLLPGLFVRLRMPLPSYRALVVPDAAVNFSSSSHTESGVRTRPVCVVDEDGKVELRWVVVGQRLSSGVVPIREGLNASDWVATQFLPSIPSTPSRKIKLMTNKVAFPTIPKKTEN